MSSSSSIVKQQSRRRMHPNRHQSRNSNAYFGYDEHHRPSLINSNSYWNEDNNYYYYYHYPSSTYPKVDRSTAVGKKNQTRYQSKSVTLPPPPPPPPRHRRQYPTDQHEQVNNSIPSSQSDPVKPSRSSSSSSTNSHRREIPPKNHLAATAAAMATRQQTQSNINTVQTLMNSLILQQQQAAPNPQLTNALLATVVQQRLKEAALQVQAALPTFLAAQALAYQQHFNMNAVQPGPTAPPLNIAHPGTKFNNRPLVKFPVVRPSIPSALINPMVRPIHHHHRLIPTHPSTITSSMTNLPTYQQVQEIERGHSLNDAIQSKNAIDIVETTKSETEKL